MTHMSMLTDAIENVRNAMIVRDREALETLTAKELSYGHASGVIEDKTAFIDAITSGKTLYQSIRLSNQTITEAGDIAIVRHRFEADVLIEGVLVHSDIQVMQIWRERDGWKLIARQAFKVKQ